MISALFPLGYGVLQVANAAVSVTVSGVWSAVRVVT